MSETTFDDWIRANTKRARRVRQPVTVELPATVATVADETASVQIFGGETRQLRYPPGLQLATGAPVTVAIREGVMQRITGAPGGTISGGGGGSTTPGPQGPAGTVAVGDTNTLVPGSAATVSNRGTSSAAILDFGIPRGAQGLPGTNGRSFNPRGEWSGTGSGGGGTITPSFATTEGWTGTPPVVAIVGEGGRGAIQNGDIGDSQTADESYTFTSGAGTAQFYFRSESEQNYDFVTVLLDNATEVVPRRSGVFGYNLVTMSLAAGTHVLRFVFTKDGSVSTGIDGWQMQDLAYPAPSAPPPTYAVDDIVTYQGQTWRARRTNTAVAPVAGPDWELWAQRGATGASGVIAATSPLTYDAPTQRVGANSLLRRLTAGEGSAPPTAGTWAVGDHYWNTTPSAGGVDYWVCVAAGTPGTWVASPLLATS